MTRVAEKEKEAIATPMNTLLLASNQSIEGAIEVVGAPFGSLTPMQPDKTKSKRKASYQATTPIILPTARKTIFSVKKPLPLKDPLQKYYSIYTPMDP